MNQEIQTRWSSYRRKLSNFWGNKVVKMNPVFNKRFKLYDYFEPMIGDKKEVKIADLGAGIMSTTGNYWDGVKVEIYASDYYAKKFEQICNYFKIKRLIPVEFQDMEHLTYPNNMFDIVHCVNALDHTVDPVKVLLEMQRVCKPGGYIYLRHRLNVGVLQKYYGQHQWNIEMNGNECIFWNEFTKFNISYYIKGFKHYWRIDYPDTTERIVSIYQKPYE